MAIEKQQLQIGFTKNCSSLTSEELCLVPPTFESFGSPQSTTVSVIIIDDDEDEALDSKDKKTEDLMIPPTFESLGAPQSTSTVSIITIDDDDEDDETLGSKDKKTEDFMILPTSNSSGSLPPSSDAIITINDDEDKWETLESKKKKPILGSWWDDDETFNELSIVVKGLPKSKNNGAESSEGSCFSSSTHLHEKKKDDERLLSSSHHDLTNLSETESVGENTGSNKGNGHVSLEEQKKDNKRKRCDDVEVFDELSSVVKGLPYWYAKGNDVVSRVESWFSSTFLHESKTKKQKKGDERSLPSSDHHVNLIDSSEDKIVGESTSSNRGDRHVSLDELGVSVEDLKSMPWEAFDPTWEIRSEIMDPWLGGYVEDMLFPQ